MDRNQTDVLIIGGGVVVLASAHYLSQAGRSVRLIEKALSAPALHPATAAWSS
jgi:glycine/D-amino acid oxidase-like deaminating enzyme